MTITLTHDGETAMCIIGSRSNKILLTSLQNSITWEMTGGRPDDVDIEEILGELSERSFITRTKHHVRLSDAGRTWLAARQAVGLTE